MVNVASSKLNLHWVNKKISRWTDIMPTRYDKWPAIRHNERTTFLKWCIEWFTDGTKMDTVTVNGVRRSDFKPQFCRLIDLTVRCHWRLWIPTLVNPKWPETVSNTKLRRKGIKKNASSRRCELLFLSLAWNPYIKCKRISY